MDRSTRIAELFEDKGFDPDEAHPLQNELHNAASHLVNVEFELAVISQRISRKATIVSTKLTTRENLNSLGILQTDGPRLDTLIALREEAIRTWAIVSGIATKFTAAAEAANVKGYNAGWDEASKEGRDAYEAGRRAGYQQGLVKARADAIANAQPNFPDAG